MSLISDVVLLKKMGATWKGLCPFHQEQNAVVQRERATRAFSSASDAALGGDAVKFVELQQKLSFPEAVRYLAQRAGLTVPEEPRQPGRPRGCGGSGSPRSSFRRTPPPFFPEKCSRLRPVPEPARNWTPGGSPRRHTKTFGYGYAPAARPRYTGWPVFGPASSSSLAGCGAAW